jgi:hypothetical protein
MIFLISFKGGIRYIADDLIRRVSGQDHFELITSLNLTLAKDGGKIKVRYSLATCYFWDDEL